MDPNENYGEGLIGDNTFQQKIAGVFDNKLTLECLHVHYLQVGI